MQITGKLIKLFKTQTVGTSNFEKREFILLTDTNTEYPQELKFQLLKDKVNLLDNVSIDSEITIHFNLQGRKWTNPEGKDVWFNSLNVWKYEVESKAPVYGEEEPKEESPF
jgi:hypothetical protein